MMASQGATQVLALVTSVIVARFLGPREVGLAAEALVFGSLAFVIVEGGFGSVLVQRPTLSPEDESTAFWTGIALGIALTLIGVGLSWPIAALYGEPEVQPLFALLSLAFLFTAPGIVPGALLMRTLRFRSLQLRTVVASAASGAVAITLAVSGFGAWAIIAQHLVMAGLSTVLVWMASTWRPRAVFSIASLKGMAGYTSRIFGVTTLSWGSLNLDNLLIGRFLGPSALGAYTIAFSIIVSPVNRIARPITQVFFPAFSRRPEPAWVAGAWLRAVRMVAFVVVPISLCVMAVAPELVDVLFGARWKEAIPVIQILAPVGMIQALVVLNEAILESQGNARALFRFTAVLSIATVAAFAAGLPWGIEGVATAYLLVNLVMQPAFVWLTTRAVGLTLREWFRSIAGVLQAGTGMLAIVLLSAELLLETGLGVGPRLAALLAISALAYVPLIAWRAPEVTSELRELYRRRRGAAAASA